MHNIHVGGEKFPVDESILLKTDYFTELLKIESEKEIVINRSRDGFRHILE